MAGRESGKKALLWGAFAHSLPDFDFISHFWTDTIPGLLSHRGFTHSISFGVLSTLVLTILVQRIFPKQPLKRTKWWLLFSVNIFAHIFLDTFNAYGTGWFEPFAHNRFLQRNQSRNAGCATRYRSTRWLCGSGCVVPAASHRRSAGHAELASPLVPLGVSLVIVDRH